MHNSYLRLKSARLAWLGIILGLLVAVVMGAISEGAYHDDDLTHLQMARWSWEYPSFLIHDWGRPGFTVLYAIPAKLGVFPSRVFSAVLTALTAWLAFDIARRQRVRCAAVVPFLFWLQPLVFTLGYTWLTETAFAFYLTLGMWLYLRRNFAWSAAVISLCMVTRHEGALILAIWAVAYWLQRRKWEWLLLGWAPVVHNIVYYAVWGWSPFVERFLRAKPTALYGSGGWLHMFGQWQITASSGIILLAIIGIFIYWRRDRVWLWFACGFLFLVGQTVIFRFGLFASGGYARFLVSISPVVAVVAAEGVGIIVTGFRRDKPVRAVRWLLTIGLTVFGVLAVSMFRELCSSGMLASHWVKMAGVVIAIIVAAVLAVLFLLWWNRTYRVGLALLSVSVAFFIGQMHVVGMFVPPEYGWSGPLRLDGEARCIRKAAAWVKTNRGVEGRRVLATHSWAFEFLGVPDVPAMVVTRGKFLDLKVGDLFIWDGKYSKNDYHGLSLEYLRGRSDFVEVARDPVGVEVDYGQGFEMVKPYWIVFERIRADADVDTRNLAE